MALDIPAGPHTATMKPLSGMPLARKVAMAFNSKTLLSGAGDGSRTLQCRKQQILFAQGDAADAVFYIIKGWVKLTVVSTQGKEAVVAMLDGGDFFGEACLAGERVCSATATSLDVSTIVRIEKASMRHVLQHEPAFSELFMSYLVNRNVRIQEDLIDQLFNPAEKRLARTLLLLAHFGREDNPEPVIPKISQETLAEMIGTTRSRVSFFLNRFKKLGFIECTDELRVHKSLLNVVLAS
jgi:CRP/FNR family cyclic AMP-dependent transcriptional regulator